MSGWVDRKCADGALFFARECAGFIDGVEETAVLMNRHKAGAFGFCGEIDWSGVAGFRIETEFVDAFAGVRRGVGADVNGVILSVECEGNEQGDGGQECFHGARTIGNWKCEIGNSNRLGST